MKKIVNRLIFIAGWLLSPFTFWNDVFINIPIAYLCANLFVRVFKADFLFMTLVFYWLSNLLGVLMMYAAGKNILKEKKVVRELIIFLATVVLYSLILILLGRIGILKPVLK
ncbi:MAG: hypothetical protein PHI59_00950 [Candidatus Omnitrophica bacterium]|nr:hypothetical protein [Candidatus Omnitrophota bacterium]MDD5679797.1 hypothetical protein [Candidatus Omnitrophota bacterium]